MRRVLFLTYRMQVGYGVDVVVANVAAHLRPRGIDVMIACLQADGSYPDLQISTVSPDIAAVKALVRRFRPNVIVAHTTPFFEMLPYLQSMAPAWAWEHGDPSPSFFGAECAARQEVKNNKLRHTYPRIAGVLAISEFIRGDIGWPAAHVIYSGCNHVPQVACKSAQDFSLDGKALRVGTLMRLGRGEACYKGGGLFLRLQRLCHNVGLPVEWHVMGRGTAAAARSFKDAGMQVHLNAPSRRKWDYLRSLDVFVSCSLWEGFNLPLVEAQAMGTLGMALDAGAHPEVTPFIGATLNDLAALIGACASDRALLLQHGRTAWHFVRSNFSWEETAARAHHILALGP